MTDLNSQLYGAGWLYENKMHPVEDKEREYYDEMFGRGTADPDVYGYPDEPAYPTDSVIVCKECNLVERKDDIDLTDAPF